MARYLDKLNELLEAGTLSQADYDELADLSAAKEAIKEFNQVKSERDDLQGRVERFETAPKRKEALKRVGIDYDAQPKFAQRFLDGIDAETLDDLEQLAKVVNDEGFEAKVEQASGGDEPAAAQIVSQGVEAAPSTPTSSTDSDFYRDLDAVPDGDKEAVKAVMAKHGRLATEG